MAPTTQFEDTSGAEWTSLANERAFLEQLEAETSAVLIEAGRSAGDRPLWRMDLGSSAANTLYVHANVHADEPAPREAALIWLRDLAYSTDPAVEAYLADHRIVCLPDINPDGVAGGTRHNANGVDGNRDGFALSQPETTAVMDVVRTTEPQIVVDGHERTASNPAMSYRRAELVALYPPLGEMGDELLAQIGTDLDAAAITHELYPFPGRPSWREYGGLHHAVGVLLESTRAHAAVDRVEAHRVTFESIRGWHDDEAAALASESQQSRQYQAQTAGRYVLENGVDLPWPQVELPTDLNGYQLQTTLPQRIIDGWGVVVSGSTVQLSQQARAVIPILLDEESDSAQATATRILAAEEGGSVGLPQVATAQIRTRLTWLSCDLASGQVITELPDLQGDEVERVIGRHRSARVDLPIPTLGTGVMTLAQRAALAASATQPPRTMIAAVVNDVPTWAGIVLPRDLGTQATIPLGCVTLEGYLTHRYIGDHSWDDVDVSVIAAGLLADAGDTAAGSGIGLIVDSPSVGVTASRVYVDTDDQTVYEGLVELMDAGLIEWTIDVDWRSGFVGRIIDKIARVRGRLGIGETQAVFQSSVFSSQGAADAAYVLREDYSGDRYANVVRLSGAGEGEDQPRSAPVFDQGALDSGVPVWELRDSAPQNIVEQEDLDRHAEQRLERVRRGARTLDITARWDADGTRYGVDWRLGDTIGHELRGHAHPDGLNGSQRVVGFALSIRGGTIRPMLQEQT